jgi:hypothetical protein
LSERGVKVRYNDPSVPILNVGALPIHADTLADQTIQLPLSTPKMQCVASYNIVQSCPLKAIPVVPGLIGPSRDSGMKRRSGGSETGPE